MSGRRRPTETTTVYESETRGGVRRDASATRQRYTGPPESDPWPLRAWRFLVRVALTAVVWWTALEVFLVAWGHWQWAGAFACWALVPAALGAIDGRWSGWQGSLLAALQVWPAYLVFCFSATFALDVGSLPLTLAVLAVAVVYPGLRIRHG